MKKSNIRKTAAIGLAFLGLAGVTVASAANLGVNGENSGTLVQAGVDDLSADLCQNGPINVTFTNAGDQPGSLSTGLPFGYDAGTDALWLTPISEDCDEKTIEVALGNEAGGILGETAPHVLDDETSLTLALNGSNPAFGSAFDNDDIEAIAWVSVTIYDTP